MPISHATLLYCCLNARTPGSVSRALATAEKLGESFDVTLVLDDSVWDATLIDSEVRILPVGRGVPAGLTQALPAAGRDEGSRRDRLLREIRRLRPRVLLVDGFPLERKELAEEMLALIEVAREENPGGVFVASVSDCIMGERFFHAPGDAERRARILNRCFDAAIVRSDPIFARLEEFFQPKTVLRIPVYHAGFVPLQATELDKLYEHRQGVVVCASAGASGKPLIMAAIEAHQILQRKLKESMTVIGGGELPERDWLELRQQADGIPGLHLKKYCPDEGYQMAAARWCICECDPDAALNVLRSGTPSILVPGDPEHEQAERARRLTYWGAGRMLMPRHLNGASLANELHQLTKFQRRPVGLNMQGAGNITKFVAQSIYRQGPHERGTADLPNRRLH